MTLERSIPRPHYYHRKWRRVAVLPLALSVGGEGAGTFSCAL